MKLSRLEKRILILIRDAYPIPYDPDSKDVLAIGERPVVTDESLNAECTATLSDVRQVTEKLHNFQLIKSVYLLDPREFIQQGTGPGYVARIVVIGPPGGPFGQHTYQITKHGIAEIDKFPIERLKRAGWKAIEDKGVVAVVAAATAVLTWFLTRLGLNR